MKCEQCGASMTLEDEFCPYCGALNKAARQHLEDMKRFSSDYEKTKSEVMENVGRQSRTHSLLIAVIILAVLNAVLLACQFGADDIRYWREEQSIRSHSSEYEKLLASYEAEGDYRTLGRIYSRKSLYEGSEALENFSTVAYMGDDLARITDSLYYLTDPDADTYYSEGELLERAANGLQDIYETYGNKDKDYYREQFAGSHLEAAEDIKSRAEALLKSFCHLTDEDIAGLPDMGSQEIMILLGRRMGIYE